jgi:hypothetical protein
VDISKRELPLGGAGGIPKKTSFFEEECLLDIDIYRRTRIS